MVQARSTWTTAGLPLLDENLARLQACAALSCQEFLDLKRLLKIIHGLRTNLELLSGESFPRLVRYLKTLHALPDVAREIEATISDNGEVLDQASAHLAGLRRDVNQLQSQIVQELQRIIHSATLSKALQEPIYTIRNGRYVLPVEVNHRSVIAGIVHDSSASGLTIYVEPLAVLELANKKRIKETEIEREVARILADLSTRVSKFHALIEEDYKTAGKLDLILAKARLALKYLGTKPVLLQSLAIHYKHARHPLLVLQRGLDQIVANDILLGDETEKQRALIITGPNTGGKTVLLKTVGIFAIMMRAGMLLPVSSGSQACLFDAVFADIGDEQSIEQSLSTFSSHMQNIVNIVDLAHRGALVLLDEIGVGTDPREGAAIARALLENLSSTGAMTIATTHFSELKTLAYMNDTFLNASLEFDDVNLSPSYKLRLGIPGNSKAMTIARRLGLNVEIIERALELLDVQDRDLQTTIELLEKRMSSLQKHEVELEARMRAVAQTEILMEKQKAELDTRAERERQVMASQLENEFQTARDYVRHLIADLQKAPATAKAQRVQKELETLRKELGWMDQGLTPQSKGAFNFSPGQEVKVRSLNQRGTLISIRRSGAEEKEPIALVRAGQMNIKVPVNDLEMVSANTARNTAYGAEAEKPSSRGKPGGKNRSAARTVSGVEPKEPEALHVFVRTQGNTLDLRGQRVDEALANLDSFLSQAIVNNVSPAMIIHGHGTGALRAAVRDLLATTPDIEKFRPGETFEGGDGVTIVEF